MTDKDERNQAADGTEGESKAPRFSLLQMGATGIAIALLVLVILIVISATGRR